MDANTIQALQTIGKQLDFEIYPSVFYGGIVKPHDDTKSYTRGGDLRYVNKRKKRPSARSWQRPTRWQRTTYRQRQASEATQLCCPSLQANYQAQIEQIREAYPSTSHTIQSDGMWLVTESMLLNNNSKTATFVICVPFIRTWNVRGWGFWNGKTWIGPRHTNFPDGSICAFDPSTGIWNHGDSLLTLIDLFTVWAVKHLYLSEFERWPGRQCAQHPYERMLELKENELCGCDREGLLYRDCCMPKDIKRDHVADAINYSLVFLGGQRQPPIEIIRFLHKQTDAPNLSAIYR